MPINKSGADLHRPSPFVPLPQLDDSLPPVVRSMIAALVRHQAAIVSARVVVLQVDVSGKVVLKATHDL